jgi:ribosomal protein L7Ae-like RNA K-turn-binding protein
LHASVPVPEVAQFLDRLHEAIVEKVRSLLSMAARAGRLASGASAVEDALRKSRVEMLIFAEDIAEGTKEKLINLGGLPSRMTTLLTRDEMGKILGRELVGVVALLEKGFADAVWSETERLKGLRNKHL